MIKITLEKAKPQKVQPYFEIYFWNIPKRGMKLYSKEKIESDDIKVLEDYLVNWYILQEKIKNKEITANELTVTEISRNSYESPYIKHTYEPTENVSIPVVLEDEHLTLPNISNIELEYVKYFDEYGVEYNINVKKFNEILEEF